jgi:hypothetical protein
MTKRGVQNSVLKRIAANRQRAANEQDRDEREREAIRTLNQKLNASGPVGQR